MFDILSVTMEGFKSYAEPTEFSFPDQAGLYYLTGENKYNSHLGANGTGKTSFIDAINWCFYGKTTRGLKAGEVVSWGHSTCTVAVTVTVADKTVTITRRQNPNSLTLDGDTVEQVDIDKFLRLSMEAFHFAVILPQMGESFFDLQPTAKLTLFSQIMNLDFWLAKSKAASIKAEEYGGNVRHLEIELAGHSARVEALEGDIASLKKERRRFDDEHQGLLKELKAKLKKTRARADAAEENMQGFEASVQTEEKRLLGFGSTHKSLQNSYFQAQSEVTQFQAGMELAQRQIRDLSEDRNEFSKLKGTKCPTCLQIVDPKHVAQSQDKIDALMAKRQEDFEGLEDSLKAAKKHRKGMVAKLEEIETVVELSAKKLSAFSKNFMNAKSDLRIAEAEVRSLEDTYDKERSRKNPYAAQVEEKKERLEAIKIGHEEKQADLEKAVALHEAYSYWINGFKRIRLYIIEEAVKQLELEINNQLTALGLLDWFVTLEVEREKKTGGITRGFSVFIHSPKHEKPVRFEAFSGGETQRLRNAGDMALSTLILQRAGLVGAIEMYDEPSEHMSPEGLADLVEVLAERASTQDKKIWLVDHNTIEAGYFAGTLKAVMDEEGNSKLEWASGLQ